MWRTARASGSCRTSKCCGGICAVRRMPYRRPFRTAISGSHEFALRGGCGLQTAATSGDTIGTHSPAGLRQFAEDKADVLGWGGGMALTTASPEPRRWRPWRRERFALRTRFSCGHQPLNKLLHLKRQPLQSPSALHLQDDRIVWLDLIQSRTERAQRVDRCLVHAVDNISSL